MACPTSLLEVMRHALSSAKAAPMSSTTTLLSCRLLSTIPWTTSLNDPTACSPLSSMHNE
eukprot:4709898-Pyramimonas_sp.AAC.1